MEQIVGYIERITFQSPESGFTVAQLQPPGKTELICVVGTMPSLQPGETVRCMGGWTRHLVYGQQFEVSKYEVEAPADILGIRKYLGSGLIKGIGPKYAGRIVEKFGLDTLDVIDNSPEKLHEIEGIGKKRVSTIRVCWEEQRSIRELMIFLQSHDVSPTFAQKIFKAYGKKSVQTVKENPFSLARDIFGIGFKTADQIAEKLGIANNASQRVDAGIDYVLAEFASAGHVCYPCDPFLNEAEAMLAVTKHLIQERVSVLKEESRVVLSEMVHEGALQEFIWMKSLHVAERGIAREIRRLLRTQANLRSIDVEKAIEWAQSQLHLTLAKKQKIAVANALSEKIQIITGGPGTGKSTITNTILSVSEQLTDSIYLAAPTGRAAKRMTEITGKKAYTIHSLLEYNFKAGGFKRNRQSPLDCDLIIIDEASMIDTFLMYNLLKAIPSHARVIFVGDIHQLPSVGPGNVLKDMIASNCLSVTLLTEIFRQAAGSRIVTNAHLINSGKFPDINNRADSDFFFVESNEPERVLQQIVALVTQRIPTKYRFNPIDGIQVLAPMKKGVIGTENLNSVLQETLNPKDACLMRYGKKFSVGDKVMQIRNNYKKNIYNGDVGRIARIDTNEQHLFVIIDDRDVQYDFSELDELVLAYAVSIHKYQGSECPCIVIPIHTSHYKLLHRNLLYTGITRGKQLVILVGMKKALAIAVRNDEVKRRYTGLRQALVEVNHPTPSFL